MVRHYNPPATPIMPACDPITTTKMNDRALIARQKALKTLVYISGFHGAHSLETGLAYYYRGHYIYAFPAGTLLESEPFCIRYGISYRGIVAKDAPVYECGEEGLEEEVTVGALRKSIEREMALKREMEEQETKGDEEDDDTATTPTAPSRPPSRTTLLIGLAALRDPALQDRVQTFTPRPNCGYLAASAPGSRLASRAPSPSGLRPISSCVGLPALHRSVFGLIFPFPHLLLPGCH